MQESNEIIKDIYRKEKAKLAHLEIPKESKPNLSVNDQKELTFIITKLNNLLSQNHYEFAFLLAEIYDQNTLGCQDEFLAKKYFELAVKSSDQLIRASALNNLGVHSWSKAQKLEKRDCRQFNQTTIDYKKQALNFFKRAQSYKQYQETETMETESTARGLISSALDNYNELFPEVNELSESKQTRSHTTYEEFIRNHSGFSKETQAKLLQYAESETELAIKNESNQAQTKLATNNSPPSSSSSVESLSWRESKPKSGEEISQPKSPQARGFLGNSPTQKRPAWNLPSAKKEDEIKEKSEEEKKKYNTEFPQKTS